MIRAVVFDFDGTLVDSNEIKRNAFFEVARELDPTGSAVRSALARCPSGTRHQVARALAAELEARGALPDGRAVEEVAKSLVEAYTSRCEEAVSACAEIPGAGRALRELAARGLPLFLATATPLDAIRPILRRRGLEACFDAVYGAPASKRENLGRLLEQAGLRPAELLVVGDGEDDREAAGACGCPFVGVVRRGPGQFRRQPERRIADLEGLPGLLDALGAGA